MCSSRKKLAVISCALVQFPFFYLDRETEIPDSMLACASPLHHYHRPKQQTTQVHALFQTNRYRRHVLFSLFLLHLDLPAINPSAMLVVLKLLGILIASSKRRRSMIHVLFRKPDDNGSMCVRSPSSPPTAWRWTNTKSTIMTLYVSSQH